MTEPKGMPSGIPFFILAPSARGSECKRQPLDRHGAPYCGGCVSMCPFEALELAEMRLMIDEASCVVSVGCALPLAQ